jgi:hypothetical protein
MVWPTRQRSPNLVLLLGGVTAVLLAHVAMPIRDPGSVAIELLGTFALVVVLERPFFHPRWYWPREDAAFVAFRWIVRVALAVVSRGGAPVHSSRSVSGGEIWAVLGLRAFVVGFVGRGAEGMLVLVDFVATLSVKIEATVGLVAVVVPPDPFLVVLGEG